MEYRVTIAIPEVHEDAVYAIFEALRREAPDAGTVMHQQLPGGPTDYMLGLDAADAHDASTAAVTLFRQALSAEGCGAANSTIVDLHAELVSAGEREEQSELQTA